MKPRRIVVTIDEISLSAFDRPGRAGMESALERELVRIFTATPAAPRRSGYIAQLSAPPLALAPNASAGALAAGLAERIHGGVAAVGKPPKRSA